MKFGISYIPKRTRQEGNTTIVEEFELLEVSLLDEVACPHCGKESQLRTTPTGKTYWACKDICELVDEKNKR